MLRLLRLRNAALVILAAPWMLAGCGGTGSETNPPAESVPAQVASTATPPAQGTQKPGEPAKPVTPVREMDTRQLVEPVKSEVKGGEASRGPTPEELMWSPPEGGVPPQDEPLAPELPRGLPALTAGVVVPTYNPLTKAKVELGKQLYFDPRVSKDGTVSCATCHNPEKGWTDNLPMAVGIGGQVGSRSAPTVLNTVYGKSMFWDGRAPSLEAQAQGPIQNKIEMGDQSYEEIIKRLRSISGYTEQFHKVFGTDVTLDGMAKAIAAFERTVVSGNSPYDRYNAGDTKALTESQKRGMVLFGLRLDSEDDFKTDVVLKKANCTSCHAGFNFSDEQFHNLGVGWDEKARRFSDLGRWAATPVGSKNPADIGAFKTPTLRDVARTAPYLHNGSESTLEKVVEFYDRGGNPNPYLDKDMKPLKLTASEKSDLVEFLKALSGDEVKVALPSLPAGPDGKRPDPRAALKTPEQSAAMDLLHAPVLR